MRPFAMCTRPRNPGNNAVSNNSGFMADPDKNRQPYGSSDSEKAAADQLPASSSSTLAGGNGEGADQRDKGDTFITYNPPGSTGVANAPSSVTSPKGELIEGTTFHGRYTIEGIIGRGGMGVVYKAKDSLLNRVVALKILHRHMMSERTLMRFQREAETISRLDHPNIVRMFEFGVVDDNQQYIVMEFLPGELLAHVLARDLKLNEERFLKMVSQICSALAHAHERQVLHRDLKPQNIMIVKQDGIERVKILDFGIARLQDTDQHLTSTGELFGSPMYMSPEQCAGARLDTRSDIYSLGCCMYEMVSGTAPFNGNSFYETIRMQMQEPPFPLHGVRKKMPHGEAIESIIFKCLEKKPSDRYQSVQLLEQEFLNIADYSSAPQSRTAVFKRMVADKKVRLIAGGALAFALGSVVTLGVVNYFRPPASTIAGSPGPNTSPAMVRTQGAELQIRRSYSHAQRLINQGKYGEADAILRQCVRMCEELPPLARSGMRGLCIYKLAVSALLNGEPKRAQELLNALPADMKDLQKDFRAEAAAIERQLSNTSKMSPARVVHLCRKGEDIVRQIGVADLTACKQLLQRVAYLMNHTPGVATEDRIAATHYLGMVYHDTKDWVNAKRCYDANFPLILQELAESNTDVAKQATVEAKFYAEHGDLDRAAELIGKIQQLLVSKDAEIEHPQARARILSYVWIVSGLIDASKNNLAAARTEFINGGQLATANPDTIGYTFCKVELGKLLLRENKRLQAARLFSDEVDLLQPGTGFDNRDAILLLDMLSLCCDGIPEYRGCSEKIWRHARALEECFAMMTKTKTQRDSRS